MAQDPTDDGNKQLSSTVTWKRSLVSSRRRSTSDESDRHVNAIKQRRSLLMLMTEKTFSARQNEGSKFERRE